MSWGVVAPKGGLAAGWGGLRGGFGVVGRSWVPGRASGAPGGPALCYPGCLLQPRGGGRAGARRCGGGGAGPWGSARAAGLWWWLWGASNIAGTSGDERQELRFIFLGFAASSG